MDGHNDWEVTTILTGKLYHNEFSLFFFWHHAAVRTPSLHYLRHNPIGQPCFAGPYIDYMVFISIRMNTPLHHQPTRYSLKIAGQHN